MAKITSDITVANRINQAIEVWALLEEHPKMSQAAACEQVGISPTTYRKWIAEAGEALDLFREMSMQIKRLSLQKILMAQGQILDKLIKDGVSGYTDPATRLMIYQYFSEHADKLLEDVHAQEQGAADFLSGPKLEKAESRFSAQDADITITIHPKDQAIDITPRDLDEE